MSWAMNKSLDVFLLCVSIVLLFIPVKTLWHMKMLATITAACDGFILMDDVGACAAHCSNAFNLNQISFKNTFYTFMLQG